MKSEKLRRVIYILIPMIVFFTASSFALRYMEKKGFIDTRRKDDLVAMPPVDFLKVVESPYGDYYKIDSLNMIQSSFAVQKDERTLRIVVTGGSFAMGTPHVIQRVMHKGPPPTGGIPDRLCADLQQAFPDREIEVINAAAGSQNSSRVREIVEIMLKADPDILIVATGNNEGFVPPTVFNEALHRWTVYRFLKKAVLTETKIEKRPYFTPQDQATHNIVRQYKENIAAMIDAAKAQGVPLILATLPVNLKYLPIGIPGIKDPEKDERFSEGMRLCDAGMHEQAISILAEAADQPFAPYYMARCFEKAGDHPSAKHFYEVGVEQIPCNRMRPSLNDYLRRICAERKTLLADLDEALGALSENGIPTGEHFVDYCHMTKEGYGLMAETIFDLIIQSELIENVQ